MAELLGVGVGAVGHAGTPSSKRKRPDLCAAHGHPGVTFNQRMGWTWCLCGEVVRDGNQVARPHAACCGGPLEETLETTPPERMRAMETETTVDPTTWPPAQQNLLRWIAAQGGWYATWEGAPTARTRDAVVARLGLSTFQREHWLHEPPWYEPANHADLARLRELAKLLPQQGGPWNLG